MALYTGRARNFSAKTCELYPAAAKLNAIRARAEIRAVPDHPTGRDYDAMDAAVREAFASDDPKDAAVRAIWERIYGAHR